MRERARDKGRLEDIIEYSNNIAQFIQGVSFEKFSSSNLLYFSVMKNIEVVGEASFMYWPFRYGNRRIVKKPENCFPGFLRFFVQQLQSLMSSPLAFWKLYCSMWNSGIDCTLNFFPYFFCHL